jgi:3-hydroxybutyryl-CoA dehydrogenase
MTIHTVGVLGCGLMGTGIAQVCAAAGYRTVVRDVSEAAVAAGLARIRKSLADGVAKGRLTQEAADKALRRITGGADDAGLRDCDLVIEAIVEQLDEKRAAYAAIAGRLRPDALIASNTSSLCITQLAQVSGRPDRFGGLHFFNPVPLMKLVEVTRGLATSDDTFTALMTFATSLGKDAIATPDRGGFVVNRLLVPYLLDAIREHENGLGSVEDIDTGMVGGCGHPMGPFRLIDLIGLDTIYHIAHIMFDEFREARFAPPPLLKRMVMAGRLGRKAGHGFYTY